MTTGLGSHPHQADPRATVHRTRELASDHVDANDAVLLAERDHPKLAYIS